MQIDDEFMTMDGEEAELIDKYEEQFGEVPFVAFLHPDESKKMIRDALKNNRPFTMKDLEPSEAELATMRQVISDSLNHKAVKNTSKSKQG
ncbi:hypothetical protein H261_00555 [Paramagnetospirillum caucaseum]|uniref:Uncharacterized protein n=1 Tax=Paramagnetospirillum caucaseum TaxID=1244869 RepID=M3AHJ3_9PROT|nr:hypothetical protein [Paramagnetospirillum caucaseum]EME72024.1 hypothetical protein H261_00555 [Paramagnetospirillum caucaseum]